MSLRSQLAAELKEALPTSVKIIDVPRGVDGIETKQPVIVLYRSEVGKSPAVQGSRSNKFSLWVISPNIDPRRSEDSLDDTLDDVLEALDKLAWLSWSTATRSTFGDQQAAAYEITLTVLSTI